MDIDQPYHENEAIEILTKKYSSWIGSSREWMYFLWRYFLACAKAIWRLLPEEESRHGVEIAEKYMSGLVSEDEFWYDQFQCEEAAYQIEYDIDEVNISIWVKELEGVSQKELGELVHPSATIQKYKPKDLLTDAAHFANFAMTPNPLIMSLSSPVGCKIPEQYLIFLSPSILREILLSEK